MLRCSKADLEEVGFFVWKPYNNGVEDLQFTDTRIYFNEPRTLSYTGEVVEMRLAEPILWTDKT